jgi:cysteine desulfurase
MDLGAAMGLLLLRIAGREDVHYFDHNASTPVAPEVLARMRQVLEEDFGNPTSIHAAGQRARRRVEEARRQVAARLGCEAAEIVFTSGGTESDNLAIFGAPDGHIITSAVEHPAVLEAARRRVEVTVVPVDGRGLVNPDEVRRALRSDTALITIMHANNETGVVQPVEEIARVGREAGVLVHSDGVQVVGKIPVDLRALGVDLYSLSGHKLNAPKGVGALYVRKGVEIAPRAAGGRHEKGLRAGTENVAGIAALGEAAARHGADPSVLRDRLEQGILARVPGAKVNGAGAPRTPNTTNIRFEGVAGEALVIALDLAGFAVSTGAACSSGAVEPSHVLTAMGLTAAEARGSMRFSLGLGNDVAQVDLLIEAVAAAVERLRRLAPAEI